MQRTLRPSRIAPFVLGLAGVVAFAAAACSSDDDASAGGLTPVVPGDPRFERDPSLDVELSSRRGEATSHEEGANCMRCHQRYGPGPGLFTVAGTAYGEDGAPRPDATLRLVDTKGDTVLELETDARGNFYSTVALPLPEAEVYPSVRSIDGLASNAMPFGTISGACNVCHGPGLRVTLLTAK
jgi:hypothetical protein